MYVRKLVTDYWTGTRNNEAEVDRPSIADIQSAVERLDGEQCTLVTLEAGEAHLAVGGGSRGRYIVCATFDNEIFQSLVKPDDDVSTVLLKVGGQEGDYSSNRLVDRKTALAAATTFAETGDLDPRFHWAEE